MDSEKASAVAAVMVQDFRVLSGALPSMAEAVSTLEHPAQMVMLCGPHHAAFYERDGRFVKAVSDG
jgi:hypothetical protein